MKQGFEGDQSVLKS